MTSTTSEYKKISSNDYISHVSYMPLCDYCYDGENHPDNLPPNNSIVHVQPEYLWLFFQKIKGLNYRYILVTSNSDMGLEYQKESPVWKDMIQWVNFQTDSSLGYNDLVSRARCDNSKCDINHQYSYKMKYYTFATFDKIPDNIYHWFCVNGNVDDTKITPIPFGIVRDKELEMSRIINSSNIDNRIPQIYINFQFYTYDRTILFNFYKLRNNNIDIYVEPEAIPYEQYINKLLQYKYVLAPSGNGLDCYRTLEAIYCGCIPIVSDLHIFDTMNELPLIRKNSLFYLSTEDLKKYPIIASYDKAKLSYWKRRFKLKQEEMMNV